MPCFKGLAVSIHTPDGPISEYSIQKQSRASRISSYIAVPEAKVPPESATGKPEQSKFAISVTLLTPGLNVPYSTPKPTDEDPYPRPRLVGGLPGYSIDQGRSGPPVPPYIPRTPDPKETIAAYIYFDGRAKEEVATLLRRGEETWVNSRWVSIPDSEGGGLAEREFLFREVGLERWLNGLDLEGSKDKAERVERRQRRMENKRQKKIKKEIKKEPASSDDEGENGDALSRARRDRNAVLRYGSEAGSPVEDDQLEDGLFSSDSDSDDEPPQPEAAGQIKIALFRVLASGEIRRGEYSPQFDAHDGDDDMGGHGASNGDSGDAEIDHTTSFAKPTTLDPSSISTQTVTGLDPPEAPYATFTFFYRGQKQLRKMGIIESPAEEKAPMSTKRKASGPDFSKLGPLKSTGTKGFSGYRDGNNGKQKEKKRDTDAMDSDADDEDDERMPNGKDEAETKQDNGTLLSPEDARRQGELAEGVQKIKLKRQHSAEPLSESAATRKSPYLKTTDESPAGTPKSVNSTQANAGTPPEGASPAPLDSDIISSPFKRARASLPGLDGSMLGPLGSNTNDVFPPTTFTSGPTNDQQSAPVAAPESNNVVRMEEEDEEL